MLERTPEFPSSSGSRTPIYMRWSRDHPYLHGSRVHRGGDLPISYTGIPGTSGHFRGSHGSVILGRDTSASSSCNPGVDR